jgi:putative transposase
LRNHRTPTGSDTPANSAATVVANPSAIANQNTTRSARDAIPGRPGDRNGSRPVNSLIQPAGLPIATLHHRALRRPIESAQYTSHDYIQVIDDHRVLASVGSVGDAYDNAMAESFVDTFKTELIKDRVWQTRSQLELAILEYVDWFNNRRLHESLGDIPPLEFEAEWADKNGARDEGERAKTAPIPVIHERPEAGLSAAR